MGREDGSVKNGTTYETTEAAEKRGRKIGIMEEWNDGILGNKGNVLGKVLPIIPRFQHSNIPCSWLRLCRAVSSVVGF
jgi:hypothetical protein